MSGAESHRLLLAILLAIVFHLAAFSFLSDRHGAGARVPVFYARIQLTRTAAAHGDQHLAPADREKRGDRSAAGATATVDAAVGVPRRGSRLPRRVTASAGAEGSVARRTTAGEHGPSPAMPLRGPAVGARSTARYLNVPAPHYPESALLRRIEGRVVLRVAVDTDGAVSTLQVEQSSGDPALDRAALAAVAHWRFYPAQENGVAVACEVRVPVSFSLPPTP